MSSSEPVGISAQPVEGQFVTHQDKTYHTIREGHAYILVPPNARTSVDPKAAAIRSDNGHGSDVAQTVFYNPIQQFNRDLSVLAIRTFAEDFCAKKRRRIEQGRARNREKKDLKRKREANGVVEAGAEPSAKVVKLDELRDESEAIEGVESRVVESQIHPAARDVAQNGVEAELAGNGTATTHDDPPHNNNGQLRPIFRILDALSATGLRALRYASEIPQATAVTANDLDVNAVQSIKMNVEHNKLSHIITPNVGNAIGYMYSVAYPVADQGPSSKFDVVDLDPYGSAAPFIDAALQSLSDEGLLCVTCTDSGVFASVGHCEKSFSLYGGMPVKGPHSHEGGLRVILHSIAATAGRYGISIEPLLSLSIDFYVRMFVRVRRRPADVKFLAGKTMIAYECDSGCGAWTTQGLGRNVTQKARNENFLWKHTIAQAPSSDRGCEHCGRKMHIAGPMWAGPIHNASFIEKVLSTVRQADNEVYKTIPRIEGMLVTALEELHVVDGASEYWPKSKAGTDGVDDGDHFGIVKTPPQAIDLHPFFFIPSAVAKVLHCRAPPEAAIKGALRHAGYRATRSHCKPGSIKTDAPWSAIWRIMKAWATEKAPIKEGSLQKNHAGWKIMYGNGSDMDPEVSRDENATEESVPTTNGSAGIDSGANGERDVPARVTSTDVEIDADTDVDGVQVSLLKPQAALQNPSGVVFDEVLGRDAGPKLVRYQTNPRENWGPMARAKK